MEEKILIKSERINIGPILLLISIILSVMFLITFISVFMYNFEHWPSYALGYTFGDLLAVELVFAGINILLFVTFRWLRNHEIVVTNKRVYGKTAFGKRVDLPMDSVSSVASMRLKRVSVATSSGNISFFFIKNHTEIHKCVSALLLQRQNRARPVVAQPAVVKQEISQSNADELKKYKELLDMGVITQAEFDAKKKQLLGL